MNRKGWVALIGVIVAGLMALATAVNDYVTEQTKATTAAAKDKKIEELTRSIFLNGQRTLYPLRGITLNATFHIKNTTTIVADYMKQIDAVIARDPTCERAKDFQCGGESESGQVYRISQSSPLYPHRGTLLRAGLENTALSIQLLKRSPQSAGGPIKYSNVGHFEVCLCENSTGTRFLTYVRGNDEIGLTIEAHRINESVLLASKVESIVDFMPGAVAASGEVFLTPFLDAFRRLNFDLGKASVQMVSFSNAVSAARITLQFPYPITIKIGRPFSVECISADYLAALLPEDPKGPQNAAGLVLPQRNLSEPDRKQLCDSLVPTNYKPIRGPESTGTQ